MDDLGVTDEIQCISTIYDSAYFIVKKDSATIRWLNDRIVKYMLQDFVHDQIVKNEAQGEIGLDWATLTKVPNNATEETINQILENL